MLIEKIAQSLEQLETRTLDPMGYMPCLSTVTGLARSILAVAELTVGIVISIFGLLALMGERTQELKLGAHLFGHGVANLSRGIIEMIPFINMITMAYDGGFDKAREQDPFPKPGRFSYRDLSTIYLPLGLPPVYQAAEGAVE